MRDKLAKLDGLRDVTTDLYIKNPQMTVDIDREKAAVYGITADQIRQELFNAYGSRQVATIYTPSNDYQVILETLPQFQANPSELARLRLKIAGGQTVPLEAVARSFPTVGPLQVNHQGQQPSVDDLIQSRTWILAGAGGRRHPADRARSRACPQPW